jgi:outer membrane murein-binding lipoprotein Lpp
MRLVVGACVVGVLVLGGGLAYGYATSCHDDWCTGSSHRVEVSATPLTGCTNDVNQLDVDGVAWRSNDQAPASWANRSVPGVLRVTDDGFGGVTRGSEQRRAVFTADSGESITFVGGPEGVLPTGCHIQPAT